MNKFTVTSEVMELDEFSEKQVLKDLRKALLNIANKSEKSEDK